MSTTTTNLGLLKPELTDPADITQMNQNWDALDGLIPHGGAAPSGFGLGVNAKQLTNKDDLNLLTGSGFFGWGVPVPENAPVSDSVMLQIQRSDNSKYQKLWQLGADENTQLAFERLCSNDAWTEWRDCATTEFAPSGYGLGGEAQTVYSWYDATETGFYKSANDSPNGQWFEGFVIKYNDSHCVQCVWRAAANLHYQRQMIDNTWGEWINYSSTAFASAGYGYGEQMTDISTSDATTYSTYCAKINDILAQMPVRTTKLLNIAPPQSDAPSFGACAVILYKGSNDYASLVSVGHSNMYAGGWRMQKRSGSWLPFEYIDPPTEIGEEYRTTERWQGKAVYTKLVNFGALPNKTLKQVQHGAAATNIIRYAATRSDGEGIPFWYSGSDTVIDVSKSSITITTTFDSSAKTATVQIWYTKD